jgi:hypothetical protein
MPRTRPRERTSGWERRPVDWSYSVAFKKPRSGKLMWVDSGTQDEVAASKIARALVAAKPGGSDYREYGLSKTYYRLWTPTSWDGKPKPDERWREIITKEEYTDALKHKAKWVEPSWMHAGAP